MAWMKYVKTTTPVVVVDALRRACLRSDQWECRPTEHRHLHTALVANYIGEEFTGADLGLVAIAREDEPHAVALMMRAHRGANGRSPVSDDEYVLAEALVAPILDIAGELIGTHLQLSHPPRDQIRPLRGVLAKALHDVTAAYWMWQQREIRSLHPTEYERFWKFIRVAHQVRSVLRPHDVAAHLNAAGFHQDLAKKLQREYEIGRQVLAVHSAPWDLRRIRKEERRQRPKSVLDS
ncbi:MAG: hypothetical protein ACTS3F_05645 [Phycisphaerales bacterium]